MAFDGSPRTFLGILVKGALLQIPTFGFYRFWLVTRLRRHLWAHTRIGAEPFEYTGTGRELLIGFLIAMAVLVPIYIAYGLVGIIAEEMKAFASLPLTIVLLLLWYFAAYRARRYRASRTLFRGIRFWMTGSGWGYAARALGWNILTVLTFGLALPWSSAALERYMMRRTRFGSLEGDFVATGGQLMKQVWWLWVLVGPVPFAGAVAVGAGLFGEANALLFIGLAAAGYAIAMALLYPLFLAAYARWQANGIRFGPVSVQSDLPRGAFIGTFLKFVGALIGLLIAFAASATVYALVAGEHIEAITAGDVTAAGAAALAVAAAGYLALLLGMGVISRHFLTRGMWAATVPSITVANLAAIDEVVAAGAPSSAFGEGLADGLDFGGL